MSYLSFVARNLEIHTTHTHDSETERDERKRERERKERGRKREREREMILKIIIGQTIITDRGIQLCSVIF